MYYFAIIISYKSREVVNMSNNFIFLQEYQQRLLHVASYSGQNKIVKMLLSLNVNIDSMDYVSKSATVWCD